MFKSKSSQELHEVNYNYDFPSVNLWIKLTGWSLLMVTGLLIVIGSILKYNVTVKGVSLVRPLGGTKFVESPQEGTIKYIAVEKNQIVNQGDVIAILDHSEIEIEKNQLISNIQQKQLKIAQIDSQLESLKQKTRAEAQFLNQEMLIAEMNLTKVAQENHKQHSSALANLQEVEAILELAKNEVEIYQKLFNQGIISQLELKEKLANLKIAEARLMKIQTQSNREQYDLLIAQQKLAQLEEKKLIILANLSQEKEFLQQQRLELETGLIQEQKNLDKLEKELEKSIIRASASGIILKLNLSNEQEFVQVNDLIAEIIPQDVELIIKTLVSNQDIDQVTIGQKAKLQINACPYQEFGTLPGVVTQISPDLVSSSLLSQFNTQANNSYFEVTIKPQKLSLSNGQRECVIKPGMNAQANIISRQETFLQFLLRKSQLFN